jgi:limonene-1,2-epoxide hydrolase
MTNTERVHAFISAWERRDVDDILSRMTEDAVYHNMPMDVLRGRDEIRPVVAQFISPASGVEWTIHHIAESAKGAVLTERTDAFHFGSKAVSIRVMGIFEFRDGLISYWRDYFDLAQFQSQMT